MNCNTTHYRANSSSVPGDPTNRLKVINDQIEKYEQQLAKLQGDQADAPVKKQENVDNQPPAPLPDEIAVWGHDITIQPNHTYRYRMTVEVYNPLFAHKIALMDSQKALSEKFTLASAVSEWSDQIKIKPWMQVFMVNAWPAKPEAALASSARAQAEVYRYRGGRWWLDRFTVVAGDRVGGVKDVKEPKTPDAKDKAAAPALPPPPGEKPKPVEVTPNSIDYRTDWFVLDIIEDIDVDSSQKGYGAMVLLQSLTSDDVSMVRHPKDDSSDPERHRLFDAVKFAELENAVASNTPASKSQ